MMVAELTAVATLITDELLTDDARQAVVAAESNSSLSRSVGVEWAAGVAPTISGGWSRKTTGGHRSARGK